MWDGLRGRKRKSEWYNLEDGKPVTEGAKEKEKERKKSYFKDQRRGKLRLMPVAGHIKRKS